MRHARLACVLAALAACRTPPMRERPSLLELQRPPAPPAIGDEIVVCGQRFHTGAPVVLWTEAPGYNAYQLVRDRKAEVAPGAPPPQMRAYTPGRERRDGDGLVEVLVPPEQGSLPRDLAALQAVVDQFVLHYDVCGTSRTCHRVLRERGLSVHFLLDIDGTIYQTLDLADTAWHATKSNARSVGVEIAHIGAYADARARELAEWYARDASGTYITVPERFHGGGVRTSGFLGRPAREGLASGTIQSTLYHQYDFTPEQYTSLAKLAAVLTRVLPRIEARAPRDGEGRVVTHVLEEAEWERFSGILGHYHVQANKQDPGPAFDWDSFLHRVREERDGAAP